MNTREKTALDAAAGDAELVAACLAVEQTRRQWWSAELRWTSRHLLP